MPPQTSALFQSSIREGIKHYYDDLDFKNILDYVQQKVARTDALAVLAAAALVALVLPFSAVLLDSLTHPSLEDWFPRVPPTTPIGEMSDPTGYSVELTPELAAGQVSGEVQLPPAQTGCCVSTRPPDAAALLHC